MTVKFVTSYFFNTKGRAYEIDGKYSIWDLWALTSFSSRMRPLPEIYGNVYGTSNANAVHLLPLPAAMEYMLAHARIKGVRKGYKRTAPTIQILSPATIPDALENSRANSTDREVFGCTIAPEPGHAPAAFGFFGIVANECIEVMGKTHYGADGYYFYNGFSELPSLPAKATLMDEFPQYKVDYSYSKMEYQKAFQTLLKKETVLVRTYVKEMEKWAFGRGRTRSQRDYIRKLRSKITDQLILLKKAARAQAHRNGINRPNFKNCFDKEFDFYVLGQNILIFKPYHGLMLTLGRDLGIRPDQLAKEANRTKLHFVETDLDGLYETLASASVKAGMPINPRRYVKSKAQFY